MSDEETKKTMGRPRRSPAGEDTVRLSVVLPIELHSQLKQACAVPRQVNGRNVYLSHGEIGQEAIRYFLSTPSAIEEFVARLDAEARAG
jgi:hypothetical protein